MKFSVSLTLERADADVDMRDVIQHAVEMAQIADEHGFEIVWVGEHHTIESNIGSAPFQLLTQMANRTDRVRLGTACVVAPYWHPIRLAGESAFFDHLTSGRLELGIGRGAFQYEFDRMAGGIPQQEGVAYMQELVPVMQALWQGDYSHDGKYWSFPRATSVPKPKQKDIPIWIAARDPGTFNWAVANGFNIHCWPITRPFSELLTYKQRFDDALAASPQKKRPRLMAMRHTHVYEKEDGWRIATEAVVKRNGLFENLFRSKGGVSNGFPDNVDIFNLQHSGEFSDESLRENLIFGKPDDVIAKLRRYEEVGVDNFCYYAGFGLPYAEQKRALELFGREVIPAFIETEPKPKIAKAV